MSDFYDKTIQDLASHVDEMLVEVAETKRTINRLCVRAKRPPMYPDAETQASPSSVVRSDQFYGRPLATVVREVLELRHQAMSVADIYSLLVDGGYEFDTANDENAKRSLRISLTKNSIFHKLPNGSYGMTEWYPAVKNGGKRQKSEEDGEQADDDSDAEAADGSDLGESTTEDEERLEKAKAVKG